MINHLCPSHTNTHTHFPSTPENRSLKLKSKVMLWLCVCVIHLAHRQCHSCHWQLSHHIDDNSSGPGSEILLFHSFPGLPVVGKAACGEVRAPLFVLPCFHSRIPWMTTIQIYPSISGGQHEIFALIGNWHFVGAGTRSNIPIHKTLRRGQWEPNFVINHFLIWHFELFRFPFSAANSHGRLLPRCSFPPTPRSLSVRSTLRWSISRAVKV